MTFLESERTPSSRVCPRFPRHRWESMRTNRILFVVASVMLLGLVPGATLFGQNPSAVVNGTVIDPSGASVPDALVTVVNQQTSVRSTKTTAGDGTFTIVNLLPGNYVLTVEKTGFKKVELPVFKLDVNQNLTEQISLAVGATSETVTVSAESIGVMVQRASTELGTTF